MTDKTENPQSEGSFTHIGRKLDKQIQAALPLMEQEVHRAQQELERIIAYLNDEVVPDVRRQSSHAMRAAANRLTSLANRLDEHATEAASGTSRETGPPQDVPPTGGQGPE